MASAYHFPYEILYWPVTRDWMRVRTDIMTDLHSPPGAWSAQATDRTSQKFAMYLRLFQPDDPSLPLPIFPRLHVYIGPAMHDRMHVETAIILSDVFGIPGARQARRLCQ
eukprot:scaffold313907_cov17-Prasinocladus_malaysianus.AAC.1